ncbi:MAG: hypothetical protein K2N06_12475 [Oscillospiraceae bacterium]|nr:hypothetical protein [Oscillospiraceae bacterium]
MEFDELFALASEMANEEKIEEHTYISEVVVAVLSSSNEVYIGKSIKTTCSLGLCAEMVAMANMILNGETEIKKWWQYIKVGK